MTTTSFLAGSALLAVVLASLAHGARRLRARLWPGFAVPMTWVADLVSVATASTVLGLALGTVGWLERWPFVVSAVILGNGVAVLAGRAPAVERAGTPSSAEDLDADLGETVHRTGPPTSRPVALLTAVGVGVVVVEWVAHAAAGFRYGMRDSVDTLWYHGPMSARFVQTGSTRAVHHFDLNPVTAFYPGGTSVLHAEGILLYGRDVASPLLNLVFLALAFLAVWAIGQRFGAVAPALLGLAAVLGTPMLVGDLRYGQPGGEYNDLVGLALVLAAVAVLLWSGTHRPGLALAAAAAGLAAGTKLSMLAPVAVLTLLVVVLSRRRARAFVIWAAGTLATGGYWYIRNIAVAGSPLPGVELPLGPLAPPSLDAPPTAPIGRYLLDRTVVHDYYARSLARVIGPAWWGLLLLVVAGGVAGLLRGPTRLHRALSALVLLSLGAYLWTPLFIGNPPLLFDTSVRFAIVPLALGPAALAATPWFRRPVPFTALCVALGLVLAVDQGRWRLVWVEGRDVAAAVGFVAAAIAARALLRGPKRVGAMRLAALASIAALALAGTVWLQHDQARHRSSDVFAGFDRLPALDPLLDQHDARIGVDHFYLQYPLYGYDLSNHVQYLGRPGPQGAFGALSTCAAWKVAINRGHYDFVFIAADHYPVPPLRPPPSQAWAATELGRGLRPLARDGRVAASYRVLRPLDPATCP